MDPVYPTKLFLAFMTGGFFVTITLYAAEKYGPKLGGVIAGLPSTTATGLFFIGFTQTAQEAGAAATIIPAAAAGSLVYVAVYVMSCGRFGYKYALAAATLAWFAISLPLAILEMENIILSSLIFSAAWITTYACARKRKACMDDRADIKRKRTQIIARAVFAGTVTTLAVVMSGVAGPLWGGAFAAFPAVFFTTFVILARDYGPEYSADYARTTPIGLFSVMPYAWGVHWLYPGCGIVAGTVLSYLFAFAVAGIVYVAVNLTSAGH
ncbi:MAG: DUF3147 family protein [Candidatus Altiarchaeota archaeon]|nr:DUF3147 family protein [Candidatus Altiarchaeota archaeon]